MSPRFILLALIVLGIGLGIYLSLFRRPPAEETLANNKNQDYEVFDYDEDDESTISHKLWDAWIKEMNYVSIGKVFNTCNSSRRLSIGRVVMSPDRENGGVTSRTFINVTLTREITGGLMHVSCEYGGKSIYKNQWDLCSAEDGTSERSFVCPIGRGRKKFVKQMKIPNYLPKGNYKAQVKVDDEHGRELGCGIAAFFL